MYDHAIMRDGLQSIMQASGNIEIVGGPCVVDEVHSVVRGRTFFSEGVEFNVLTIAQAPSKPSGLAGSFDADYGF